MLLGFEKAERGSILFGQHDVTKVDLRSLRQHVGVVMQDGKLFMGNISDNITISTPTATLDDAWEAARKVGHCKLWDDYTKDTGKPSVCAVAVLDHYTAYEAIEKLKAYEEKQKAEDEIKVGDEVETKDGKRFVVTTFGSGFDGDIAVGVCADGLGLGVDLKELHKTGRHFDISSILKEMQS